MSWSNLANNQIVSDSNLSNAVATGVFTAKTSIPITGRELTSTAASDYAYVSAGSRPSNSLVSKSSLSAVYDVGPYNYYGYGADGNYIYQSKNGGFTFAPYTALPFQGPNTYTVVAANSTGQYLIAASDTINYTYWLSQDYGASFQSHNILNTGSQPSKFPTFYPINADMSADGRYMAIVGKVSPIEGSNPSVFGVAISSDYGSTFNIWSTNVQTFGTATAQVTVSGNGSTICFVGYFPSPNTSIRYCSINYGASFVQAFSDNQVFLDVSSSYSGQYICIPNYGTANTGNIFVSSNYGAQIISRYTPIIGVQFCGMTTSGGLMYVGTSQVTGEVYDFGRQYYSTNFGVNWNIYSQRTYGSIGMGVGDLFVTPMTSSYLALFQTIPNSQSYPNCVFKPTSTTTTFYTQPLTYGFSMKKIFKKAFNY